MFNKIDCLIIFVLLIFFIRGAKRGLLRSILGPLSLLIAGIGSYIYYLKTKNLLITFFISILGPFAIEIGLAIFLKFWNKTVRADKPISLLSQLTGACFTLLWSGSIFILCLLLAVFIPLQLPWLTPIQKEILASKTYAQISKSINYKLPQKTSDITAVTNIVNNPEKMEQLETTPEYQDVMSDPKIKALIEDPDTVELIKKKDVFKLLSDPRMTAIMEDQKLIQNLLKLNRMALEENKR